MNPQLLRMAMVSAELGSVGKTVVSEDTRQELQDFVTRCRTTMAEANVDSRFIARGLHEVTNYFLFGNRLTEETFSFFFGQVVGVRMILDMVKPSSVFSPESLMGACDPLFVAGTFDDIELNFLNNASLYLFEENRKNRTPGTTVGYKVYDKSEILEDRTPKFDMILSVASTWASDPDFCDAMIDSVKPGGTVVILSVNDSSAIYSPEYRWHQYYDMHDRLRAHGKTYHLPSFYGTTVLLKG